MSFIFQAGGALSAKHRTYIERRQADYNALRAVHSNQFLNIIAPRQTGKTSLLNRLVMYLSEENWRCSYVDLSRLTGLPKASWYTQLGELWAADLTPGYIPVLTNQIEMSHYLVNQALNWPCEQPNILLILDEVESILSTQNDDKFFSEAFFMTLRSLFNERNSYKNALVVALAGAISPIELVKNPAISPFNVGEKISLEDFTPSEAMLLTNHLTDLDLPINAPVHQAIYDWTEGHPYLMQRICFEMEKSIFGSHNTQLTVDNVTHSVNHTFLQQHNPLLWDNNLQHVYNQLNILSEIARPLWARLQSGETVSVIEVNKQAYLELYLTGAIKPKAKHIFIRNRIYEEIFLKKPDAKSLSTTLVEGESIPPGFPKAVSANALISYSHRDKKYLDELHSHIAPYVRSGSVHIWDDTQIRPGANWSKEIERALQSTQVAILLISADFLASDFIANNELPLLLTAAKQGGTIILCIILRSCIFQSTELAQFQSVNMPSKPLAGMKREKRDEVWAKIAGYIKEALEKRE